MAQVTSVFTTFLREHRTTKPDRFTEVPIIQKKCVRPDSIALPDLADLISQGGTFRPCATDGNSDDSFISGQLVGLDFDNNKPGKKVPLSPGEMISLSTAIETARRQGMPPFLGYETFSSKSEHPRFRLLWCLDRPLIDRKQWEHIMWKVRHVFPENLTDGSCVNPARLFFGTNRGTAYIDCSATLNVQPLLADYVPPPEPEPATKPRRKARSPGRHTNGSGTRKVVEAIRTQTTTYLRRRLNRKRKYFDNRQQFFDFLYREIDLAELLDVEPGKAFSCVLPSHDGEDVHPSANVFRDRFGGWKYKCFAENLTLNTKQFFELLGNFRSEYQALEFIKAIYNVQIRKTAWAIEQEENISLILDAITGSSFRTICPTASYTTRNCQQLYLQILCIARNAIFPERTSDSGNIIFFMSVKQLAKASGKGSIDKVAKYLKMLQYHGLLEAVPDEEVPKRFLQKAIEGMKNGRRHISFYRIPSWVVQQTQFIESQGQKWKANGYRLSGISYELFFRTEGEKVARMLYPATADYTDKKGRRHQKQTGRKADKRHQVVARAVLDGITDKGYTTEREVLEILHSVWDTEAVPTNTGKVTPETQLKRSMADILATYALKKVRANKELKQEYAITAPGYPTIIIPE